MEPDNLLLDQYILSQAHIDVPKICFIPTASGDADNYIERFYEAFEKLVCTPSHLSLFSPNFIDLKAYVLQHDILYVGGVNTRNMLSLWKEWELDTILKEAYEKGVILAGISAGSICWFEEGVTDSMNNKLSKIDCLGFLTGSNCPHYDGESNRRPSYHELMASGEMKEGYAVDDGVALHFKDEKLSTSVSSRATAKAYAVDRKEEEVIERELPVTNLGNHKQ
ncbi:Type 1 glutamine amidotransferase-like domain-containing protein [Priestia megaterium]|uniref:Type 1 glutamine amidotransferase-like domain-containing protein n=2 Tax=Bacillaceae TaxID=186817 RepID=A0AAX6BKM2_PRIMG|nr:Type 1 glutamine amidotransferase-like domain-containing protein [Priestia megaterium]